MRRAANLGLHVYEGTLEFVEGAHIREGKKKRQHYVPQFLLRRISGEEGSINLVVLETGKFVEGASIKGQCYGDYFYGKDPGIENLFEEMEGNASKVLRKLEQNPETPLTIEEDFALRLYVHYQNLRTQGEADLAGQMMAKMTRAVLEKDKLMAEALAHVNIKITNTQAVMLESAVSSLPLFMDLEVKLLVRNGEGNLILSDNPVVLCNQWAENHPKFSSNRSATGLATKGLQVFLPVGPKTCLAYYDPSTYEYGSPKRVSCSIGSKDVKILNQLQIMAAEKCTYLPPDASNQKIVDEVNSARLLVKRSYESLMAKGPVVMEQDGKASQLIAVSRPFPKIGTKMSFVRETDQTDYTGYTFPVPPIRSPELFAEAKRQRAFIKAELSKRFPDRKSDPK